jgi:plastocyanin
MRKSLIALPIAVFALLVPLAVASPATAATTVTLGDNFFAPSSKTIARGVKVRFKWIGVKRHNVKKRRGPGAGFKSRTTRARGVNYAKRFTKRGTYRLICTIHPETMRLKLTVR